MADQRTEDIYAAALAALEEGTELSSDKTVALQHPQVYTGSLAKPVVSAAKPPIQATQYLSPEELRKQAQAPAGPLFPERPQQQERSVMPSYESCYSDGRKPIAIVTSQDLAEQKPPLPRLFENEQPRPVVAAHSGEVVYKPIQPQSSTLMIAALIAAIFLVLGIGYASLVTLDKLPAPAFLMYGASRGTGVSLSEASDFSQAPQFVAEDFENQEMGEALLEYSNSIINSLQPVSKAYGELGKHLSQGGVPNFKQIKDLTEKAEAASSQASRELSTLQVPGNLNSSEAHQYLDKVLLDAKAMIKQGQVTISALYVASAGRPIGFTDAGFSAKNVLRNKENLFSDINRAARALGLKKTE